MMRFNNMPEPAGFQEAVTKNLKNILDDFKRSGTADFKGRETWTKF